MQGDAQAESTLRFSGTKKVYVAGTRVSNRAGVFLHLEGPANERIVVDGGGVSDAAKTAVFRDGATPAAVTVRV